MPLRKVGRHKYLCLLAVVLTLLSFCSRVCFAEVQLVETEPGAANWRLPLYRWQSSEVRTKGVVLAIHGVTLHGKCFAGLAKPLADKGFVFLAPDLRGFGWWIRGRMPKTSGWQIDYERSVNDLIYLLEEVRHKYPDKPVFCLGESIGASLALKIARRRGDLLDGLILCSPAVKRRFVISPVMFGQLLITAVNPRRQHPLKPYVDRYISEDERIIHGYENDPAIRRTLSFWELVKSDKVNQSCLKNAILVDPSLPVLIIEGMKDRLCISSAVKKLDTRLRSNDKTICWLKNKGHLIVETDYIPKEVILAVEEWLGNHLQYERIYAER